MYQNSAFYPVQIDKLYRRLVHGKMAAICGCSSEIIQQINASNATIARMQLTLKVLLILLLHCKQVGTD